MSQAKLVDAGRLFRVCDQIAEMEDKLRYVLSARTLIEMSLIRASRIATTATIDELMRAVRALRTDGGFANIDIRMPQTATFTPTSNSHTHTPTPIPTPNPTSEPKPAMSRRDILDDPKLNDVLSIFPGSTITDIKEARRP